MSNALSFLCILGALVLLFRFRTMTTTLSSWVCGTEDAVLPELSGWSAAKLDGILYPKLICATISPIEWGHALTHCEENGLSPDALHAFWEWWLRNQLLLLRVLSEQGSAGSRVEALFLRFWGERLGKEPDAFAVRGILYDAWKGVGLMAGRFEDVKAKAYRMEQVRRAATLVAELDYTFKEAARVIGAPVSTAQVRREYRRRAKGRKEVANPEAGRYEPVYDHIMAHALILA